MNSNKEVVKEFIQATNDHNWNKVMALTHPDFTRHSSSVPYKISSNSALIDFHKQELDTFPDLKENIIMIIGEGDMVAARIHFLGTQLGNLGTFPPSGKKLDACFNCLFRLVNGLIIESWVEYDNLNGLIQLGHFQMK